MPRNLFTPDDVEAAVSDVDVFRNDILGVAAFFAGLTALQFPDRSQITSIGTTAFVFILVWGFSKMAKHKAAHDRFYGNLGHIRGFFTTFARNPILYLGFAFLGLVGAGQITTERLAWLSLAKLFRVDH